MRKVMSLGMALILATAIGGGLAGCAGTRYTESTGGRMAPQASLWLGLREGTA